jgi:hypothetical protein
MSEVLTTYRYAHDNNHKPGVARRPDVYINSVSNIESIYMIDTSYSMPYWPRHLPQLSMLILHFIELDYILLFAAIEV